MSKNNFKIAAVVILAAILTAASNVQGITYAQQHKYPSFKAAQMQRDRSKAAAEAAAEKPSKAQESLEAIYSRRLPGLQAALQRVIDQLEAGYSQNDMVEELRKVQTLVDDLQKALGEHVKSKFINSRCPILRMPIDAASVPANLTRDYRGQKVAFCCEGCPAAWDKLPDAEKTTKLRAVIEKPKEDDPSGPGHTHPMGSMMM